MKEIRLDYLQNPPFDIELIELNLKTNHNFNSIASKAEVNKEIEFCDKIKDEFYLPYAGVFDFSIGGFLELFLKFKEIYYTTSLTYYAREALRILENKIIIHKVDLKDLKSSFLMLSESNKREDVLFILPTINEDIFSLNNIEESPNVVLALDISYSVALGLEIPKLADIYLINGASLGFISGSGLIVQSEKYTQMLHKNGMVESIFLAMQKRKSLTNNDNEYIFKLLAQELGSSVGLFASNYAPNTLPLRFKHINTRNLIEHLYLENIFIQSAQECSLGFIKPSYTLLSQGYGDLHSRELCAITFKQLDDIDFIVEKLASSYKMIRLMEF